MTRARASRQIPITRPLFGAEEMAAVQKPLESGWVVQGPYVADFESRFASFVGAAEGVATTSCTTALQLAIAALGLRAGDEVIVPAFTWVSTANVVELMGARAVFCDIDLATFNIDPGKIEGAVTTKTVGIIPVHLFGLSADMAPIMDIAKRRGLWIVEDAACGFGTRYHGRHVGAIGDAGCFSFHPRKAITTGEGGMVTTDDHELALVCRSMRDHGASRSDLERHGTRGAYLLSDYDRLGFNYRMTDIQGALGCAQLDRAKYVLARRAEIATRYDRLLGRLDWLDVPRVPEGYVHGYQSYVTLFRPETPTLERVDRLQAMRDRVMATLEERGIATRQGTHAAVLVGYYRERYGFSETSFPNATVAERLSLSLPLYPQMTDDDVDTVVDELERAMGAAA